MSIGLWFMIASLVIMIVGLLPLIYDEEAAAIGIMAIALTVFVIGSIIEVVDELNDPESGIIIEKEFVPEHLVCSKGCFTVSDRWYFVLDDNGNVGEVEVRHSTYNNKKVGDYFGGSKD